MAGDLYGENLAGGDPEGGILSKVYEGMRVFDRDENEVGRVAYVRFGEVDRDAAERGKGAMDPGRDEPPFDEPMIDFALGGAGSSEDRQQMDLIKSRMMESGYLRIDAKGFFASDRFALAEQIASVSEDSVRLAAKRDELVHAIE